MRLVTVEFRMNDLIIGETNIAVINRLLAKKLQRGGRLVDKKNIREGWFVPNKVAIKMVMKLHRMLPHLKFDYKQYLKLKLNAKTGADTFFKISSASNTLWDAFISLYEEYLNKKAGTK